MEIIGRHEAHAQGLSHYYTGKPCKRGHISQRQVTNGGCLRCMNLRLMPTLAAPNVGMPPSPYAFNTGVQVTPGLVAYVHARVLRDSVNQYAAEYLHLRPLLDIGEHATPTAEAAMVLAAADAARTLVMLEGGRVADYHKAGWTDDQMVAAGKAIWQYPK